MGWEMAGESVLEVCWRTAGGTGMEMYFDSSSECVGGVLEDSRGLVWKCIRGEQVGLVFEMCWGTAGGTVL